MLGEVKCFEKMTDTERIDNLLKILGFVFTPQDEKVLRDKLEKAREKPKKTGKAKGTNEFTLEIPPELSEMWNAFVEHRKKMNKPMTAYAKKMTFAKLEKLSDGDFEIANKILQQSIENVWQGISELRGGEVKNPPKAAGKQSVFGSDASYDISEFEKSIVGMRYLDEE